MKRAAHRRVYHCPACGIDLPRASHRCFCGRRTARGRLYLLFLIAFLFAGFFFVFLPRVFES